MWIVAPIPTKIQNVLLLFCMRRQERGGGGEGGGGGCFHRSFDYIIIWPSKAVANLTHQQFGQLNSLLVVNFSIWSYKNTWVDPH